MALLPYGGDTSDGLGYSTIAFAVALLAVITVHELAHGIAALVQGLRPIVHPFFELNNAATVGAKVFIALGGPSSAWCPVSSSFPCRSFVPGTGSGVWPSCGSV